MMPDACMVGELPLDAHAHILPRAGTVNPVPSVTSVSPRPDPELIHTRTSTQMGKGGGGGGYRC